ITLKSDAVMPCPYKGLVRILAAEVEIRTEDAGQHQRGACDFLPAPTGARASLFFGPARKKGRGVQFGIVRGLGRIADAKNDDSGADGDQHTVILEVHLVDDP